MFEVICTTHPVARKEHKCSYCGGIIPIGKQYERQVCKYDDVYTWKSHDRCVEIAYKLKMFDDCSEGLTKDDFIEIIQDEYIRIISKVESNKFESKDYAIPLFSEQLDYICNYHLSTNNQ